MFQSTQDLFGDTTAERSNGDAPDNRSGAVVLVGYLREGVSNESHRLYREPAVEMYIEIVAKDIIDRSSAAGESEQSMIWVRRDAILVWHESMPASNFETPAGAHDDTAELGEWPRP